MNPEEYFTQDPERWIPLPPDDWKNFMRYYSGNRPDGPRILFEALKSYFSHAPAVSLMDIHRRPSHAGGRGGIVTVTCGPCPYSGSFQKVAEHIVSEHLNLSPWYCDTNSCLVSCTRRYDLARHRDMHGIMRPRRAKKEKKKSQAETAAPTAVTASPLAAPLSPGLGPTRTSRSRSRASSSSQPYPSPTEGEARGIVSYNTNSTSVPANLAHDFSTSYPDVRGRLPERRPLVFNAPDSRNVALPRTAPPSIREPSPANDSSPLWTPPYVSEGSSHSSLGSTSFDPIDLSNHEATHPSRLSASPRQSESCPLLDQYDSSNFLSPHSLTLATSPMWSAPPLPMHWVTTPIPSRADEPTTPRASPHTQNLEIYPSPMPSPYLSPQRLPPPSLFTSFQGFYPPLAQPLVQMDRVTLSPALSSVDTDRDGFGLPPFSDDDHGSSFGLSDLLSDFEVTANDQAGTDQLLDGLFLIDDLFNE